MDAILVFDPANELLFAHTNQLFKRRLVRFAKQNNLLLLRNNTNNNNNCGRKDHLKPIKSRQNNNVNKSSVTLNKSASCNPQSDAYRDLLMLLLTPYVVSLRISEQRARQINLKIQDDSNGGRKSTRSIDRDHSSVKMTHLVPPPPTSLLAKFMNSVNLHQEESQLDEDQERELTASTSDNNDLSNNTSNLGKLNQYEKDEIDATSKGEQPSLLSIGNRMPIARFGSCQIPVDWLSNCQVVYCEHNDFMFVQMQELKLEPSSFKLRLMQRQVEFFAQLALFLFGPSLSSLRSSPGGLEVQNQVNLLRSLYARWSELEQLELSALLSANEPLLLSKQARSLCSLSLAKLAIYLRKLTANDDWQELHMHSLLFASDKLAARHSCRNSKWPLQASDLAQILLIVKNFNQEQKYARLKRLLRQTPSWCYKSNYCANRGTSEIISNQATDGHKKQAAKQDASVGNDLDLSFPSSAGLVLSQCIVFLAAAQPGQPQKNQSPNWSHDAVDDDSVNPIRVPHLLRLVSLNPKTSGNPPEESINNELSRDDVEQPLTLVLLSEVPTSLLSCQLGSTIRLVQSMSLQVDKIRLTQLVRLHDSTVALKCLLNEQQKLHQQKRATRQRNQVSGSRPDSGWSLANYLLARYYTNKQPQTAGRDDQENMQSQFPRSRPTSSCSSMATNSFEQEFYDKNLLNRHQSSGHHPTAIIVDIWSDHQLQSIRMLICRLEDLARNNVNTYMRRKFELAIEEQRREALLSSVASSLRETYRLLILEPQLERLYEIRSRSQRSRMWRLKSSQLIDEARTFMQAELTDCIDYLALKSSRNLTLGAPLTHDMKALKGFVFVDRDKQQMLTSPSLDSGCNESSKPTLSSSACSSVVTTATATANAATSNLLVDKFMAKIHEARQRKLACHRKHKRAFGSRKLSTSGCCSADSDSNLGSEELSSDNDNGDERQPYLGSVDAGSTSEEGETCDCARNSDDLDESDHRRIRKDHHSRKNSIDAASEADQEADSESLDEFGASAKTIGRRRPAIIKRKSRLQLNNNRSRFDTATSVTTTTPLNGRRRLSNSTNLNLISCDEGGTGSSSIASLDIGSQQSSGHTTWTSASPMSRKTNETRGQPSPTTSGSGSCIERSEDTKLHPPLTSDVTKSTRPSMPTHASRRRINSGSCESASLSRVSWSASNKTNRYPNRSDNDSIATSCAKKQASAPPEMIDKNLIQAHICFIYDRLANGKCQSFTFTDDTYTYSYFLWFEYNSVRYLLIQIYCLAYIDKLTCLSNKILFIESLYQWIYLYSSIGSTIVNTCELATFTVISAEIESGLEAVLKKLTPDFLQIFSQKQGQVIAINPRRRNEVSNNIRLNFKSLPGQSYFDTVTNKLTVPHVDSRIDQSLAGQARAHRRVRIRCKWSELFASPVGQVNQDKIISQLMRRRMSRVLEEETEFSTDDEDVATTTFHNSSQFNFTESLDAQKAKLASCDNFQLILQELRVNKDRSHDSGRGFRLFQRDKCSSTQSINLSSNQLKHNPTSDDMVNSKPRCFELFSIHRTSQLVHRNQPMIEAERLARRLIELTSVK